MNWSLIAQVVSNILALALIGRLLALRLHSVYRVFCCFLVVEFLASSVAIVQSAVGGFMDYRISWMIMRVITWVFYLWMVYALMGAILSKLRGILRVTRHLLNVTFLLAIIAAVLTGRSEYDASGSCVDCTSLEKYTSIAFVLERVISMAALLAIVALLAFIVFFPMKLPRNLVLFTSGYLVYFSAKTGILLARYFWKNEETILSVISMCLMSACFVYWLLTLNEAGERSPATLSILWRKDDDLRALHQLEAMNVALLRAARR